MIIKMLKTASGPKFTMLAGQNYEIDDKVAANLISAKAAEKVIGKPMKKVEKIKSVESDELKKLNKAIAEAEKKLKAAKKSGAKKKEIAALEENLKMLKAEKAEL